MQHDSLMIHCPNMKCRTANPEEQTFCLNCHTRLPKRYLRVVNYSDQEFELGDLLADRFVFRGPQVVLDVRPGLLLPTDYDIPDLFVPYLKLFTHRIHYSQIYTILWVGDEEKAPILLLDQAPLAPQDLPQSAIAEEDPHCLTVPVAAALPFTQAWSQARPLRQLNWLWQIAQLWDPFLAQGVAKSLITPGLLRVEGPLLRLLELHNDSLETPPTLADLGAMLSQFKSATSGAINFLFSEICDELLAGDINSTEALTTRLENIMATCREPQPLKVSLATQTDPGMVRTHNEDQCFPASGSYIQQSSDSLLIVCDGVGGHAGGEVASALAIEALQEHLNGVILDTLSPEQIKQELITACCHANDLISERNDQEQRQERARMGTTLVMALVHDQQLYIAHIGDSRAYLITKLGCYQLTVDDDIASREVRLGYLPYNEALRHPTSGSLVQALGMASSMTLHPTVQRFMLDDEIVLLLCSDGLSDYDRVEEIWQEELLPLLYRNYDLSSVSQRLITLANHLNGHDNVTVGLMNITYGQDNTSKDTAVKRADLDFKSTLPNADEADSEDTAWIPSDQEQPQVSLKSRKKKRRRSKQSPLMLLPFFGLLAAILAGSVWAVLYFQPSRQAESASQDPSTPDLAESPVTDEIQLNTFVEISAPEGLRVYLSPPTPLTLPEDGEASGKMPVLPQGSILKTIALSELSAESEEAANWLEVQLCDRPQKGLTDIIQKGDQVWVKKIALRQQTIDLPQPNLSKFGLGGCNAPSGNVKSTPGDNESTTPEDNESTPEDNPKSSSDPQ